MSAMRKITVEVPEGLATEIDAEVASGAYADIGQLVCESLQARLHPDRHLGQDARIEQWLVQEVGATYDAYKADPSRLLSEDEAFEQLKALVAARSAGR